MSHIADEKLSSGKGQPIDPTFILNVYDLGFEEATEKYLRDILRALSGAIKL